jgi:hypothetical protein
VSARLTPCLCVQFDAIDWEGLGLESLPQDLDLECTGSIASLDPLNAVDQLLLDFYGPGVFGLPPDRGSETGVAPSHDECPPQKKKRSCTLAAPAPAQSCSTSIPEPDDGKDEDYVPSYGGTRK